MLLNARLRSCRPGAFYFEVSFVLETCSETMLVVVTFLSIMLLSFYNRDLVALDIRGCWRVSDTGIAMIAEYCQNLKVLKIADCRYVKIGFNCDVQLDFSNCF